MIVVVVLRVPRIMRAATEEIVYTDTMEAYFLGLSVFKVTYYAPRVFSLQCLDNPRSLFS